MQNKLVTKGEMPFYYTETEAVAKLLHSLDLPVAIPNPHNLDPTGSSFPEFLSTTRRC